MGRSRPEGVEISSGWQIVITLNLDSAEWLANELPSTDGFTAELLAAIDELRRERPANG